MKKFALLLSVLVTLLFVSCKSASLVSRDGERQIKTAEQGYTVLGRIIMEKDAGFGIEFPKLPFSKSTGSYMYYELFNAAKEAYPDVDDIMNVTVDYEGTKFLIFRLSGKHTITACAIKYN